MPSRTSHNKFDPAEQHRHYIEERTAQGDTCEDIAAALRNQGVSITDKTVSRRRVEWGLRMRNFSNHKSPKVDKPRARRPDTQSAGKLARKAAIEDATNRGLNAQQIAASLESMGYGLQRGESDVLRLQAIWGLVIPNKVRSTRKADKPSNPRTKQPKEPKQPKQPKEPAVPKVSKREEQREANKQQRTQLLHYPTDCSFGPKKRTNGTTADDGDDDAVEPLPEPLQLLSDLNSEPVTANLTMNHEPVSVAAELMSVDFLVDLATSTLDAAINLKAMLLSYQDGRPAPNSQTGFPPTTADLSNARKKVREAAAVMHDLAVDPVADTAIG